MFRKIPILVALACLGALVIAVPATAQTQVVETRLRTIVDDYVDDMERNSTQNPGFFEIEFCFDAGGFNPQGGTMTFTITNSALPEWATLSSPPEPIVYAPPGGPGQQDCDPSPITVTVNMNIGVAPYDTVAPVTFTVTASGTNTGTYMLPDPATAVLNIDTEPAPPATVIPTDGPGAPAGGGGDATESPATTPLALMLTVFALALLRRRVD